MTKVSVIICCYNDGEYVSRALESVFAQTLPLDQYEVVFINDGSTDSTEVAVLPFQHYPNFRYFKNNTNLGLVDSCNIGLGEARGSYVIRLDADDAFEPTILEEMSRPLDLGVTNFVYCDRLELLLDTGEVRHISLADFNIFRLIAIGTMMWRDLMRNIGGYRDVFWEEFDLYIKYLLESDKPPYYIPKPLFTYSIRKGSMTANSAKVREGWEELKRLWPENTLLRFGQPPAFVAQ